MKRYPKYKDSGVPWLGQVPAHWEVKKVKHLFRHLKVINRGMVCEDRLALTMSGVVPRALDDAEGLQTEDYSNYQIVDRNDLLFKLIDLQNIRTSRVGHVPSRGIVSPAYIRLKSHAAVDVRFSYWYFMSIYVRDIFNTMGAGVRQSLTQSDLLELPFLMPSAPEMSAVAVYLDRVTLEIDSAILSQERMIELLKERRSAIITQAVTKGLDPKAKMKDSGVPWLGQVPAHWEVKKVKHLFRHLKVINRGMVCEDRLALTMSGVVPRALDDAEGLQTEDYSNYQIVDSNDLLFKLIDLQNIRTSRVGHVPSRGIVSPAYIRLKSQTAVDVRFSYWYFMSIYVRDIFNTMGAGVRQSLTQSDLLELPFLLPSAPEMSAVAVYLDRVTLEIDSAISSQERMIELLKERRSAIITQAVTGQIDVR